MSGSLYIIRHGRTDWNDKHILQGKTDIPLNKTGIKMAEEAAVRYKDIHFDICFCSPLQRAKETAEILLKDRDIPILYDERLREMSFGIYEGVHNSFKDPDCYVKVFFEEPEKYLERPEGGESILDLMKRTKEFLEDKVYPLLEEGSDVLIVGHGAMNSAIKCNAKKLDLKDFWVDGIENCKLMKLI